MVSTLVATVIRVIRFDNVTKAYSAASRPALDGVSFEIADGEFAFLIGPSGSGKSTFLELMVRYSNVTKGDIYFDDSTSMSFPASRLTRCASPLAMCSRTFACFPS